MEKVPGLSLLNHALQFDVTVGAGPIVHPTGTGICPLEQYVWRAKRVDKQDIGGIFMEGMWMAFGLHRSVFGTPHAGDSRGAITTIAVNLARTNLLCVSTEAADSGDEALNRWSARVPRNDQ